MITPQPNSTSISALPENENNLSSLRMPPHNFEAEKALLGAIFANNNAYDRVADFLRPTHFADPIHGRIFESSSKLIERGQIADPITLKNFFEQDSALADVGGAQYLVEIAASMVNVINAAEYGRTIYDLHLKRQLIELGENVVNSAYSRDVDDFAITQIEKAEAAHKRDGKIAGVATGLRDIDTILGGLHPSDLVILAGRPSMGKTALATNIAFNAAYDYKNETDSEGRKKIIDGAVVGFFSLEMSAEQLAARILSEQTEIASDKMRKGKLTNDEFDRLVVASQQLHNLPIYIDDTPALSVSMLRTRARRLKREHGLGLVIVDYLQLMESSKRTENRVQEIAEITRGLKTLAKELDVPVLALSQLSRAVEQREDRRPQLSDLRESGAIEQDADVVTFIFREAYYLERAEPILRQDESADKHGERLHRWETHLNDVRHHAELIIAKQRHGPTGTVKLYFDGMFTRFGDLDTQHTDVI